MKTFKFLDQSWTDTCPHCEGHGVILPMYQANIASHQQCARCQGSGHVPVTLDLNAGCWIIKDVLTTAGVERVCRQVHVHLEVVEDYLTLIDDTDVLGWQVRIDGDVLMCEGRVIEIIIEENEGD